MARKPPATIDATPAGASPGKGIANLDAQLRAEADALKTQIGQPGGSTIKAKGGKFVGPNNEDYGSSIDVVVIDFQSVNQWWPRPFNDQNPEPPECFAYGKVIAEMRPEPESPKPQHGTCAGCPQNEFGTDLRGRGKACKNGRQLVLTLADESDKPDAPLYTFNVSPTALKSYDAIVASIARNFGGPPIKAVIRMEAYIPDGATYTAVTFNDPTVNNNVELAFARRGEAFDLMARRPDLTNYDPNPKRGGARTQARR